MVNVLFVYIIIICVFKYISEKEKSTYGGELNKLYGTFVSSSKKETEPENPPAISLNVNEFENKPLFPTLLPMGKLSSVSRPATLSNGQPMPRPSSPPPPPPPKRPRQ